MKHKKITISEISKANGRLDPEYYIHIKPAVDKFLQTHSITTKGFIRDLAKPREVTQIDKLDEKTVCIIYSLIKYYDAYKKITSSIDNNRVNLQGGVI